MPAVDWSDCPLVEVIPGKVSGTPLLKLTRLPMDAITGNYGAFRDEWLSMTYLTNWYASSLSMTFKLL